jgi:hypothetical protein
MSKNPALITSTLRTARALFFGIALQATVFAIWGQEFFVSSETPPTGGNIIYILFGFMALASFAYGIRFFQNYTKVKRAEIAKFEDRKRKESLLMVTAVHLLLLEFVSIIGILLAIFVQKRWVVFPFYGLFAIGFALSYPRSEWYSSFFKDSDEPAKV